jgi:photosystem II stability/assembly factor-like uncharacterized protein
MLKLLSAAAALAAVLSLAIETAPAQEKHAPAAQDKPLSGSAGQGKPSFEHVHALALTADGRTLFLGAHSGLFRSEDEGHSWQPVVLPSKHPHVDVMAVTPHLEDARTVYVATHEASVFKTTDGGNGWRESNDGLGGVDVHGLAIDPRDPNKLHAAVRDKGEGIYRSTDGGVKWVRVDDGPGGEVKVLASVNISTGMGGIFLYAGTAAGLQRNPDCF